MRILYLRQSEGGKRLVIGLGLERPGKPYSISHELYGRIGSPAVGCELDESAVSEVVLDDERFRAFKKALALLGYSDKNKKTLFLRLRQSGFSSDASAEAVRHCVSLGYIDEERQLEILIMKEARCLRGPRLISSRLASKGYSSSLVGKVMDRLCDGGDIDFSDNLKKLSEKLGADEESIGAIKYKYGY